METTLEGAHALAEARHTIAVYHVDLILLGARAAGLAVEPLLLRAAISPALLASPSARVTQRQYAALMRVIRRALRDEFWGLLGRPVRPGTYAQAARAMLRGATLEHAVRFGLAHYRLHIDDFVARLQVSQGVASLRLFSRAPVAERMTFAQATFVFQAFGLASWLIGQRLPVTGVDFISAAPSQAVETERLFVAPTRHLQAHTAMHFDAQVLRLPLVQDEHSLAFFLDEAPGNLLTRYRDDGSLREQIRQRLRQHLRPPNADGAQSLESMATALNMTAPTLRRRLWQEGTSFQVIKDGLRRDAAIRELEGSALPLDHIAERLGFSETSAFHRAFKKWTGVAPGEYRQRHRASGGA